MNSSFYEIPMERDGLPIGPSCEISRFDLSVSDTFLTSVSVRQLLFRNGYGC